MKKTLALLLALTMSCIAFASCTEEENSSEKVADTSSASQPTDDSSSADDDDDSSDTDESSNTETDSSADVEEGKFITLVNEIIESGSLTLTTETYGHKQYMTTDHENVYIEYNEIGVDITALVTADGGYYVLDTERNRYYKDDTESFGVSADELFSELADELNSELLSVLTAIIDGNEYTVETYEYYGTQKFAFNNNGELCFYSAEDGEYVPYSLTAAADTSKLTLDGYTEMTFEEYDEWMQTLLGEVVDISPDNIYEVEITYDE